MTDRIVIGDPAPTTFPIAATTVTDDFHRADENPIGAPWDTTLYGTVKMVISGNQMVAPFSGPGYAGGAYYTGAWNNHEAIVTIATDLYLLNAAYVSIFMDDEAGTGGLMEMTAANTSFRFRSMDNSQVISVPESPSIGDSIGFQHIGSCATGWYKKASGQWTNMGTICVNYSGKMAFDVYATAQDAPVAISEFRIAEVGQLIQQTPPRRSRRTSW